MPSHQLRPALKKIPVGALENERPFAQMQGSGEAGHKKSFRAGGNWAELGYCRHLQRFQDTNCVMCDRFQGEQQFRSSVIDSPTERHLQIKPRNCNFDPIGYRLRNRSVVRVGVPVPAAWLHILSCVHADAEIRQD
jgi:hypothetical protein